MCNSVAIRIAALMSVAFACACSDGCAQAASPAAASNADQGFSEKFVKTGLPVQQLVADTIPITGKLALDKQQTRIAAARVAGRLGRIFVFEGQSVHAGDALAEIYSPDFISAENEYLLAKRFHDTLTPDGADAELRDDADVTMRSAANKLKVLGASAADIAALGRRGTSAEYLLVRAPISGVVTQRNVDPGGYLNVGDALMALANLDTLWLFASTYDADYPYLKLGEPLAFETPSLPGEHFSGQIAFIAPSVDPNTHTLPIRCDVPNRDFRLRPEMFVRGELKTGEHMALVVPKTALIHIRDSDYVVVHDSGKQYRRVLVHGHAFAADRYAITEGLGANVAVVTDGTLLLNEATSEN
jgi:membrane fusion protein, copper/silver efflux system